MRRLLLNRPLSRLAIHRHDPKGHGIRQMRNNAGINSKNNMTTSNYAAVFLNLKTASPMIPIV